MKKLAIIPSRYASTRFPGKPLIDIAGKSMIERVYERTLQSEVFDKVLIATDDDRIIEEANRIGAAVVLTAETHPSGTDRCLEAYQKNGADYDVVVNVQGDEPFVDEQMLEDLCALFKNDAVQIATVVRPFDNSAQLDNPNKVKAVLKKSGLVHSFSRERKPIPRSLEYHSNYFKHIGVYAYRPDTLEKICALEESESEKAERLEQLRWTDNNYEVYVTITQAENPAVDTPEDLTYLLQWMDENEHT